MSAVYNIWRGRANAGIKVIYPDRLLSTTINLSEQGIPQFHILQIMTFYVNTKTTAEYSDDHVWY